MKQIHHEFSYTLHIRLASFVFLKVLDVLFLVIFAHSFDPLNTYLTLATLIDYHTRPKFAAHYELLHYKPLYCTMVALHCGAIKKPKKMI